MALSTDVSLPKGVTPQFPDRCIYSDEAGADDFVTVSTSAIGWWTLLFLFGSRFTVKVPIKKRYKRRFLVQFYGREIVCLILIVIAIWFIAPHFNDSGPWRKWIVAGLVILTLIPYIAWEVFFPRKISLTAYSEKVEYEFHSESYAYEFAELNEEHVLEVA